MCLLRIVVLNITVNQEFVANRTIVRIKDTGVNFFVVCVKRLVYLFCPYYDKVTVRKVGYGWVFRLLRSISITRNQLGSHLSCFCYRSGIKSMPICAHAGCAVHAAGTIADLGGRLAAQVCLRLAQVSRVVQALPFSLHTSGAGSIFRQHRRITSARHKLKAFVAIRIRVGCTSGS